MNGTAIALAMLVLLAPVAVAEEPDAGTDPQDDASCKFFAWTLDPQPAYRIDWDCPPIMT